MEHTEHYGLKKPGTEDFYKVSDFNENAEAIDAALHGLETGKAGLDADGKVPAEQLPPMDYEAAGTAAEAVEGHDVSTTAHRDLRAAVERAGQTAATALDAANEAKREAATAAAGAGKAQEAADAALEAITKIAHTIDAVPTQSGTLSYTGCAQSPGWNSYNPETLTLGGVTSGVNAGTYTATFTPKEGYTWGDGTTTARSVTWTIGRAPIGALPSQSGTLTFTGNVQSPAWSNFDTGKMTIGGTTTGTNAGSYVAAFTPTANYQWSDGTTGANTVNWSIGRATISTVPSQSGTLTYTSNALVPAWSNYDSAKLTIGGAASGTNAGTYAATFTPTANYQWSGGGTGAKSVNWTIGKAAGSLTLNKTTLDLTNGALAGTITVTRAGDGAISAASSNTSIATVSVSGTTITVTGKAYGNATITVSVAVGSNHNAPANKTCSAAVKLYNATLNYNTWAQIREASDAGKAASLWSVGDTKNIRINGTVGNTTFSNVQFGVRIIGFNHNSSREGSNRIHFQIGVGATMGGALCDSNYSNTGSSASYFQMNTSNANSGGWSGSSMRKTLLGNNGTPSSPPSGSLLAALPSDLRAVMKSCTKYSDNTGGASDTASYVTATTDYLFLLTEWEYHGARTYANSAEKNYQAQYAYYKAGNSKVHYKYNATGTAAIVWCRSVYTGNKNSFCLILASGAAGNNFADASWALAPGFCV